MAPNRYSFLVILSNVVLSQLTRLSGDPAPFRIYILEKESESALCAYTDREQWAAVPKEKDPEFTVTAEFVDGVLTRLLVQKFTEDSTTYDEYGVNKEGSVRQLKRTRDITPERVTIEQVWRVQRGQAVKISEIWTQFATHKRLAPDKELRDSLAGPVFVRVAEFPFYPILRDLNVSRWPNGMHCIPGSLRSMELMR